MATPSLDRRYGVSGNLGVKAPVRAATTANTALSGELTIDTVALVTDDRVLAKDQTDPIENGIWVVATGGWTRAVDFNGVNDVVTGTGVIINEGTQAGISAYISTTGDIIPGTTAIAFIALSLQSQITTLDLEKKDIKESVYNASGGLLAFGTVVYDSGWNVANSVIEVSTSDSSDYSTVPAVGMVADAAGIANGVVGLIQEDGVITGIDTSSFSEGDTLYLLNAGAITNVMPNAGSPQVIGYVVEAAVSGSINLHIAPKLETVPPKNTVDATFTYSSTTAVALLVNDVMQTGTNILHRPSLVSTKTINVAWAAGTAVGGLFTGAVASDTTYYLIVIQNDTTGAYDWGYDTAVLGTNKPAGYTVIKRIGCVVTNGASSIIQTIQRQLAGGAISCMHMAPVSEKATQAGVAAGANLAIVVPTGLSTDIEADIQYQLLADAGGTRFGYTRDVDLTNAAPSATDSDATALASSLSSYHRNVWVDSSAQVFHRESSALAFYSLLTNGWIDHRHEG